MIRAMLPQSCAILAALAAATTAFTVPHARRPHVALRSVATPARETLWTPTAATVEASAMKAFQRAVGVDGGYEELWSWSVANGDAFWTELMDFVGVEREGSLEPARVGENMPDVEYFPNCRLNFAENLLRHGNAGAALEDAEAIVSISEARDAKRWTFGEAAADAARVASALRALGVGADDAVGLYASNVGESVVAMLGATATGATWTSCSPDFGARAVADRFGQVAPKALFVCDGFVSAGKRTCHAAKVAELAEKLPSLEKIVVFDVAGGAADAGAWAASDKVAGLVESWDDFLASGDPAPTYDRVPFAHPQLVLYSSGTTGLPKSIAHGCGNALLQHAKELILHSDLKEGDKMLFYTTCGWMMWNWMASSLFAGAAIVCFDGFAAYPKLQAPWDLVEAEKVTHLGTSPRYFQACRTRVAPKDSHDLEDLRVVFSTGSPLMNEDFRYVYDKVKDDVMLASISGGTDICSCFALGNPTLPVVEGELQAFGLGLDACAFDRDAGARVVGEKAELACLSPFVAAPVKFFGDDEAKTKYRDAYFDDDDGVWYHGDLVETTGSVGAAGGVVIHGRSDTTLKPGGVRIGTAEVYRFAEEHPAVDDSLVIGDQLKTGKRAGDVRIVLFVKLADGYVLDAALEKDVKAFIRAGASDAHVPALLVAVDKIPYTKSGKKVEVAVRDLIAGTEPKNVGALADATAFDEYRALAATWKS